MRITLFACLFLFSCNSEVATPNTTTEKLFFDLPSFFQSEIKLIENDLVALEKTSTVNGQKETKRVEEIDISEELSIFTNADINKTTWQDQYQVDSLTMGNGSLQAVHYTALNDNLKTKKMIVAYEKGAVKEIEIRKGIDNMAIQSNQVLKYFPQQGYIITNEQSVVLSDAQKVEIKVDFVRK